MAGWLTTSGMDGLLARMMNLSVAYQKERQNVEADDLTALVIRALGMIIGKMVRDEGELGDRGDRGELYSKRYLVLTALITQACQGLIEVLEIDINSESITSRRVGNVLMY